MEQIYQYAVSVAELNGIEPSLPVKTRQKRLPKRFEDGIICDSIGSRESVSCDQDYKVTTVDREIFVLNKFRKLNFRIINFRK